MILNMLTLQFGVPLYGASMLSEVVRSTDNTLACVPFQNEVLQQPNGLPQVLLAERGGRQIQKTHVKPSEAIAQLIFSTGFNM